MVLIQRRAYVDLVPGVIDMCDFTTASNYFLRCLAICGKQILLVFSSLRRGMAEAIEAVARGDESTSRVVGEVIGEISYRQERLLGER